MNFFTSFFEPFSCALLLLKCFTFHGPSPPVPCAVNREKSSRWGRQAPAERSSARGDSPLPQGSVPSQTFFTTTSVLALYFCHNNFPFLCVTWQRLVLHSPFKDIIHEYTLIINRPHTVKRI